MYSPIEEEEDEEEESGSLGQWRVTPVLPMTSHSAMGDGFLVAMVEDRPLNDHELEKIINAPDFYDTPSDCSGSEVDDHEEYEWAENSGCEYVPSTDDSDVDDPQTGPSKKARKTRKTEMLNEARDTQQIDDNVGSSQIQQPPTSQVSLEGENGHRWSAVGGKTSRIPMKNKTHILKIHFHRNQAY
nr:unnamed protein product [Callosobruchus analis]